MQACSSNGGACGAIQIAPIGTWLVTEATTFPPARLIAQTHVEQRLSHPRGQNVNHPRGHLGRFA